jgi:Reverse transcriptase (RNA-dependent DNA polymerase)
LTNFIDLSIRVLQGDALAPYLFVIVVDYLMRVALADQSLGLKITNKVGTSTRIKIHAKYITDLDFADDIMLLSVDAISSRKQLDSVDTMARKVGLKINRAKTEFMMGGNWASPIDLRVYNIDISPIDILGCQIALKILRLERHKLGRPVFYWSKSERATLSLVPPRFFFRLVLFRES